MSKEKHWPLLKSRNFANLPDEEKQQFLNDCLKICATNKACKAYNIKKLKEMKVSVAAVDSVNEPSSGKGLSTSKAGGLPNDTLLAEGGKVMLHSNLWTESGLTNGAKGVISKIIYKPGRQPPQVLSNLYVWFQKKAVFQVKLSLLRFLMQCYAIFRNTKVRDFLKMPKGENWFL